jgi:hypothetical protein
MAVQGSAYQTTIKLGSVDDRGERIQVLSGLKDEDQIITMPSTGVKHGKPIGKAEQLVPASIRTLSSIRPPRRPFSDRLTNLQALGFSDFQSTDSPSARRSLWSKVVSDGSFSDPALSGEDDLQGKVTKNVEPTGGVLCTQIRPP